MSEPSHIVVRNARTHNLRGVDVAVPRNALVVFTGVSGSGKSSLVFDTIYQEGQRRFVESLSSYARQFLGQMERPEVDSVEGISPSLSIDQKTVNRNPRSTVGTITEIYDHLRLLMARLGEPRCPICATPIAKLGVEQIVQRLIEGGEGRTVTILGPVVEERKGEYRKEIEELQRDGWVRARIDGELVRLEEAPALERYKQHTIEVVVDRLTVSEGVRSRLVEAVETALRLGQQVCRVILGDEEHTYSTSRACPKHPDQALPELEPRLFSFNAPQGACPACSGLGVLERFEPSRFLDLGRPVPDCFLAFNDDGKLPFSAFDRAAFITVARELGIDRKRPIGEAAPEQLQRLLHGDPAVSWRIERLTDRGVELRNEPWTGLVGLLDRVWLYTRFPSLEVWRSSTACPACGGARLNPMARSVVFRERTIPELSSMSVRDAFAFFQAVRLTEAEAPIGELLVAELRDRLTFLHEVGLDYLTLARSAATLSGGEAQRIRLASQVGSALQGVTYVLDEPSIGLHARDNQRLLQALVRLRDRGNSVLVVEHDAETILAADHVVDVGPGAGRLGGYITAEGPPGAFLATACPTARWMRGELRMPEPPRRGPSDKALVLHGATVNNLQQVTVRLPVGRMTVVTGVSGSGKSSLVFGVLEKSVERLLAGGLPVDCTKLEGLEHFDTIVRISQRPIGRTPRSNPGTYTGAMDMVRDLFAETAESRARGYAKGRFSFNVPGGRCEECEGAGVKTVEMQFLPDVDVPCEACGGRRFNRETLEILYKGRSIADVLDMTIAEALDVFGAVPKLARALRTLVEVGLEYVSLGQPSTTLSGGEAQRVKLATELQRPSSGRTLYLLDEPTTGLHFEDVAKLLRALDRLVAQGNTVVVVEHHTDVIRFADHVIDMGPEGGDAGGRVIGEGTPEEIARQDTPTGRALAPLLETGLPPLAAEPIRPWLSRPAEILVMGARKHNLQAVDVRIPHGKLTVVTGVSGSGKTSLAFDTVFAEGQRRYVESLSTYARRFLGRVERAPVDRLEGLQPAIAIDQSSSSHNPRSTVATVTEIHDVLRLLYARVGTPHCPVCQKEIGASSPSRVAHVWAEADLGPGWLCAPLAGVSDGEGRRLALAGEGWSRLLVRGAAWREVELEDEDEAAAALQAGALLVLDRLDPARVERARVTEAVQTAYRLGEGRALFVPRRGEAVVATQSLVCPEHGQILPELTPRHFSFNARIGMCTHCDGLGTVRQVVPERVFMGDGPLREALDPRVVALLGRSPRLNPLVDGVLTAHGVAPDRVVSTWPPGLMTELLHGRERSVELRLRWEQGGVQRERKESLRWTGLLTLMRDGKSGIPWVTSDVHCPHCGGGRLNPAALSVTLGGRPGERGLNIHGLARLTVARALEVVRGWELDAERSAIAARPRLELERRLSFLLDVGLGYLTLDRAAESLSGGESQRIRLASQLGAGLVGVTYVLDEPTVGLHARDTGRLLGTLEGLRDLGNTVLVVEHDPDVIGRADYVIDMGPAAGTEGGRVLAAGTPAELRGDPRSVTGAWLSGRSAVPTRVGQRAAAGRVVLEGCRANNLRVERVEVPLGVWTAVTGVSGSGKSSLVMDTLAPALKVHAGEEGRPAAYRKLQVEGTVDGVILVDQAPIGTTPRSTPATYVGVLDKLRELFAATPGAMERGWKAGRFSFNTPGGRCETCEGRGAQLIEMHFLPDVWVVCPDCRGRRYNRETLEVRFKGLSIADVLGLRADEAVGVFEAQRGIRRPLQALVDVGLGYIRLGQPGDTLSGGEAQRVKLASELTARSGSRVYVLDEPTTGLHLADVAKLIEVLHRLADAGHTVITIEHHLDMIRQADHVIELGPDGGAAGGLIVAAGTPAEIAAAGTATGLALRGSA